MFFYAYSKNRKVIFLISAILLSLCNVSLNRTKYLIGPQDIDRLPVNRRIILQEFSGPVLAAQDAMEKGITDACGPIHDIQGRLEIVQVLFALSQ